MPAHTTLETPADALDAAADYIEAHGWVQGRAYLEDGRACSAGALGIVTRNDSNLYFPAISELEQEVSDEIVHWNDAPIREQWEVTTKMRHAAKRLRGGA